MLQVADTMMLFGLPRPIPRASYEDALAGVVERLRMQRDVVAIYRLGSVSAPGISDLDVLVVFEDDAVIAYDPLAEMDRTGRYLFTHSLFAVSRGLFATVLQLFSAPQPAHLWGEELDVGGAQPVDALPLLDRQTAVEYVMANYIVRVVEARYRLFNVRSVLLSSYALRHDLSILDATDSELARLVKRIGEWRAHWFDQPPARDELIDWYHAFVPALHHFLQAQLSEQPMANAWQGTHGYAGHIKLVAGPRLTARHHGLVLPRQLARAGRRFVRMQHRLNRFIFTVPTFVPDPGTPLALRFDVLRAAIAERTRCYPRFAALASPWIANTL